jgi:uncharacterized phage infection (PIP) family protein YhgE
MVDKNKTLISESLNKLLESLPDESDDSWVSEMYADTPEYEEYIKSLNANDKSNNFAPKIIGKEYVEFKDAKGNPIKVPSEKYVDSLEEKINRLEEVIRVQNNQLNFLTNKYAEVQGQLKTLQNVLRMFGDES